jgi:hypothetical protein
MVLPRQVTNTLEDLKVMRQPTCVPLLRQREFSEGELRMPLRRANDDGMSHGKEKVYAPMGTSLRWGRVPRTWVELHSVTAIALPGRRAVRPRPGR